MFAPLDQEKAKKFCFELMNILDTQKRIDFDLPLENSNPKLKTDCLFQQNSLGQMFGICVCIDKNGVFGQKNQEIVLKAFSGQFNSFWLVAGWVPPLLDVEKFNQTTRESDKYIHLLTDEILCLSKEISELEKKQCFKDKDSAKKLKNLRIKRSDLQKKRKEASKNSMKEIFSLYEFNCINKKKLTIEDIFGKNKQPPTGSGECCAPKLLNFAFKNDLTPISMAEFYYGNENNSGTKKHKEFYTPCDEKCAPILPFMLDLEILYKDNDILVINKPSGLLSIPGRGEDKKDSASHRMKKLFPDTIEMPSVHRLDMDTSGLMVLAFNAQSHKNLSIQFMNGQVQKKYLAVLDGSIQKKCTFWENCKGTSFDINKSVVAGHIELPFRLDVENRPHQIYDEVYGKIGITDWILVDKAEAKEKIKSFRLTEKLFDSTLEKIYKNEYTFLEFSPQTGRTHQLRLHSSHKKGLNCPIVGDNLYGTQKEGQRLLLHACELSFVHPTTGEKMFFSLYK